VLRCRNWVTDGIGPGSYNRVLNHAIPEVIQIHIPAIKSTIYEDFREARGLRLCGTRAASWLALIGILSHPAWKGCIGRLTSHHVPTDPTIPRRIVPEIYVPTWHAQKVSHQSSRDRKVGWAVAEWVAGSARYIWRIFDSHAARCLICSVRSTRYETGPPGGHVDVSCVTQSPDI
jgi:hypothetical protein